MRRHQTCRFCHVIEIGEEYRRPAGMVRIATRHWAHWKCKLDSLPDFATREAWVRSLPAWELAQAPLLIVDDYGLLQTIEALRTKEIAK